MIERIVLIKLTDDYATDQGRAEVADATLQQLAGLPGVRDVAVGTPADEKSAQSWDLSIRVAFDSIDEVAPYLAHPQHRAYVDDYLRPKMTFIKAWNFEQR